MSGAMWDQRFSTSEQPFLYGEAPNAWIATQLPPLPQAAQVLALADGEGRNAVWLARQGYQVSNWDYSQVGLRKTQQLAERSGVSVATRYVDVTQCDWSAVSFDAIVSSFFHLPKIHQIPVWQQVVSALKPNGHLVVQVFAESQLGMGSGGPKDLDLLYDHKALQSALMGMNIVQLSETSCMLDEGCLHQGRANVINIHAIKPA